jgi:hypothetical protein
MGELTPKGAWRHVYELGKDELPLLTSEHFVWAFVCLLPFALMRRPPLAVLTLDKALPSVQTVHFSSDRSHLMGEVSRFSGLDRGQQIRPRYAQIRGRATFGPFRSVR